MQAVKDLIKTRYSSLMWRSGLLGAWLRVRPGRHAVAILSYHDVPAEVFADHLRCLLRIYRVIRLEACCDWLGGGAGVPPNSVVITFDDAYRQFWDAIYPVVARFGVPVSVFVPTASIDEQRVLWFNRVKAHVYGAESATLRIGDRTVSLVGDRRRAYHQAIAILNGLPINDRDTLLNEMFTSGCCSSRHLAMYRPLTWDQMRGMRGLVAYGAHTVTHPDLTCVDRSRAAEEVEHSKRRVEEELGHEVAYFAYPFGRSTNISSDAAELVRRAGYRCAVTTNPGACRPGEDPFMLPRVVCDGIQDGRVLAARLSDLWITLSA